jgi:hypothetical protein
MNVLTARRGAITLLSTQKNIQMLPRPPFATEKLPTFLYHKSIRNRDAYFGRSSLDPADYWPRQATPSASCCFLYRSDDYSDTRMNATPDSPVNHSGM